MKPAFKRLEKLQLDLTPQQAVVQVICEGYAQFDVFEAYTTGLSEPSILDQIHHRWDQVLSQVEKALKGKDEGHIRKAQKQAQETISMTLAIHQAANLYLYEQADYFKTHLALLAALCSLACYQTDADTRQLTVARLRGGLLYALAVHRGYALACEQLSKQYLLGQPILFKDIQAELDERIKDLESVQFLYQRLDSVPEIRAEDVEEHAAQAKHAFIRKLYNQAKMQTLENIGSLKECESFARMILREGEPGNSKNTA